MERLKKAIEDKIQWSGLNGYIGLIEKNAIENPNISLDAAKTILETICKTILNDMAISFDADSKFQFVLKKTVETIPVIANLSSKDTVRAKSIINSFENIARTIGEFRNEHGYFSHGQDLHSKNFDIYLTELVVMSIDVISSFLVISYAEDRKDRSRIYYEEESLFNSFINNSIKSDLVVSNITITPSLALFTEDNVAYKDKLIIFNDEKEVLIQNLEKATLDEFNDKFIGLVDYYDYMTDNEAYRVLKVFERNYQELSISDLGEAICIITKLYEQMRDSKTISSNSLSSTFKVIIESAKNILYEDYVDTISNSRE